MALNANDRRRARRMTKQNPPIQNRERSRLEALPQELLCQVIEGLGNPVSYSELRALIKSTPQLTKQINECVEAIDFSPGAGLVDDNGRTLIDQGIHDVGSWNALNRTYPRLKQYQIHISINKRMIRANQKPKGPKNELEQFLLDPRARWISIDWDTFDPSSYDPFPALLAGIKLRIQKYGSDFTLVSYGLARDDMVGLHFSYHNGILHFENLHEDYEKYVETHDEDEIGDRFDILEAFGTHVQAIGVDNSDFLSHLYGVESNMVKGITVVYVNIPLLEDLRKEPFISDNIEFLRHVTEVHFSSRVNNEYVLLDGTEETNLFDELQDEPSFPKISVMELPIFVDFEPDIQEWFPNVHKFNIFELINADYYEAKAQYFRDRIAEKRALEYQRLQNLERERIELDMSDSDSE